MADRRLRLLTFNIRMGAGGGALDRPAYDIPASEGRDAALSQAIQAAGADVVALQEVRSARQAQAIADRLKVGCIYSRHPASYSLDFFEWGLALLSRFKIVQHGNFTVAFDREVRSGRNGLWVKIDVAGQALGVINVHLETRDPVGQIESLLERIVRSPLPLVVMGDFNLTPHDMALAPLHGTLLDTCRAVATLDSREAEAVGTLVGDRRRIDYIFVAGDRVRVRDAGLLPPHHRGVSDHIGYFADIDLRT